MAKNNSQISRLQVPGDETYEHKFNHVIEDETSLSIYSDRKNLERLSCTIDNKTFQIIPDEDMPVQKIKCDLVEMITKATVNCSVGTQSIVKTTSTPDEVVESFLNNYGNVVVIRDEGNVDAVFGKTPGVETSKIPRSDNFIVSQVYDFLAVTTGFDNTREFRVNNVPDVTIKGTYSIKETRGR